MPFRALLGKEFRALRPQIVFGALALVAADVFLFLRIDAWGDQIPFGLSTVLVQVAVGWPVVAGWLSLHNEWNRGTVHWLLSYPLPGWAKVGAKLIAGVVTTVLFLVLSTTGTIWIFLHTFGTNVVSEWRDVALAPGFFQAMGANALWTISIGLFGLATLYLHGHVSYMVGQTVHKARLLVSGVVFFTLPIIGGYTVSKFEPWLERIPLAPFYFPKVGPGGVPQIVTFPAPFPAILLVVAVSFATLFVLSGWLLERRAEI